MRDPVRTGTDLHSPNMKPVFLPLHVPVQAHHEVDCGEELCLLLHPAKQMNPASCEKLYLLTAGPNGISVWIMW